MFRQFTTPATVSIILLLLGCGDDKGTKPSYEEQILGAWEAEYALENGEIDYFADDGMFYFFLDGGLFRDLERNPAEGTYEVGCLDGTYTITEDTLQVKCRADHILTMGYSFIAGGDTLKFGWSELLIVSSRAADAPDWRDWMP